jgi:hypothetical protein
MARTDEFAVMSIIEVESGISLEPFIDVANTMVNNTIDTTALDANTLEKIERYLAAWLYAIRDKRRTQERVDEVTEQFQHVEDLALNCNEYGQTAMLLDITGALARLNKEMLSPTHNTISFTYLGKTRDE